MHPLSLPSYMGTTTSISALRGALRTTASTFSPLALHYPLPSSLWHGLHLKVCIRRKVVFSESGVWPVHAWSSGVSRYSFSCHSPFLPPHSTLHVFSHPQSGCQSEWSWLTESFSSSSSWCFPPLLFLMKRYLCHYLMSLTILVALVIGRSGLSRNDFRCYNSLTTMIWYTDNKAIGPSEQEGNSNVRNNKALLLSPRQGPPVVPLALEFPGGVRYWPSKLMGLSPKLRTWEWELFRWLANGKNDIMMMMIMIMMKRGNLPYLFVCVQVPRLLASSLGVQEQVSRWYQSPSLWYVTTTSRSC